MQQLSFQGEKLSSDAAAPEPFKEELVKLMEDKSLTLEQLYNCDETGLRYRILTDKTLCFVQSSVPYACNLASFLFSLLAACDCEAGEEPGNENNVAIVFVTD